MDELNKNRQKAEAQQQSPQGEPASFGVSKQERRRLKNEHKHEKKQAEQRKEKSQKLIRRVGWLVIIVAVLAGLGWLISNQKILPPTSRQGHTEVSPQAHISDVPFSLNVQKHMLEHADGTGPPGIFINYNCKQFDCEPGLIDKLAEFVEAYPLHVYLAPYENLAVKLVLTREGEQELLDSFDEQRIRSFIDGRELGSPLIDASADEISGFRIGRDVIYVADQKPGTELTVNIVTLSANGYVVIHEAAEDGSPGDIIGNTLLLDQGDHNNIEAALNRASQEGEGLMAMLHADNGDGVFDPVEDLPIKDDQDNIVLMKFQVSSSAEEPGAISL